MNLHLIFNRATDRLKIFRGDGVELYNCEARNDAVGDPSADPYGHDCPCPPGSGYRVGRPSAIVPGEPPYGSWFCELLDDPAGDFAKHDRAGIGIHGGGSGLSDPYAAQQGWVPTCGCIRLQNADLSHVVQLIEQAYAGNGSVTLDVEGA